MATPRSFVLRNLRRLRLDRLAILNEPVTDLVADRLITRILELEARDTTAEICLLISSPGGDLKAGLAVYETMQFTACDVLTVAVDTVASVAAMLLAAGTPGKRVALSSSRIVLHPPSMDYFGCAHNGAEMERTLTLVYRMLTDLTGRSPQAVADAADRRLTLTAEEARIHGFVDHVDRLPPKLNSGSGVRADVLERFEMPARRTA